MYKHLFMKSLFPILAIFLFYISATSAQGLFGSDTNKIQHVEPLVDEYTTELGAKKQETTMDLQLDYIHYNRQEYEKPVIMAEIEYAPLKRLGLAVRLPYAMYAGHQYDDMAPRPLSSLQAIEWSL